MPPLSLQTIYLGAALLGGALLLLQIALSLLGGHAGTETDFDLHADHPDLGGYLSFRTVVAFITFFGLAGMAASSGGLGTAVSLVIAVVAGSCAFWLLGLGMMQLARLRSEGTIVIDNALGAEGRVYLTVPGERSGTGAVTVPIQGRSMQFKAVTTGPELATGRLCKVVGVHAGNTLVIEAS